MWSCCLLASASCPPSSLEQSQIYVGRENLILNYFSQYCFYYGFECFYMVLAKDSIKILHALKENFLFSIYLCWLTRFFQHPAQSHAP